MKTHSNLSKSKLVSVIIGPSGFGLVEMMLGITMAAVLVAAAIFVYQGVRDQQDIDDQIDQIGAVITNAQKLYGPVGYSSFAAGSTLSGPGISYTPAGLGTTIPAVAGPPGTPPTSVAPSPGDAQVPIPGSPGLYWPIVSGTNQTITVPAVYTYTATIPCCTDAASGTQPPPLVVGGNPIFVPIWGRNVFAAGTPLVYDATKPFDPALSWDPPEFPSTWAFGYTFNPLAPTGAAANKIATREATVLTTATSMVWVPAQYGSPVSLMTSVGPGGSPVTTSNPVQPFVPTTIVPGTPSNYTGAGGNTVSINAINNNLFSIDWGGVLSKHCFHVVNGIESRAESIYITAQTDDPADVTATQVVKAPVGSASSTAGGKLDIDKLLNECSSTLVGTSTPTAKPVRSVNLRFIITR